jgi:hypothetical protein
MGALTSVTSVTLTGGLDSVRKWPCNRVTGWSEDGSFSQVTCAIWIEVKLVTRVVPILQAPILTVSFKSSSNVLARIGTGLGK